MKLNPIHLFDWTFDRKLCLKMPHKESTWREGDQSRARLVITYVLVPNLNWIDMSVNRFLRQAEAYFEDSFSFHQLDNLLSFSSFTIQVTTLVPVIKSSIYLTHISFLNSLKKLKLCRAKQCLSWPLSTCSVSPTIVFLA